MKFSAQEIYGIRCLQYMTQHPADNVTIRQIADAEKLTVPNVAKIMRLLRKGGFITSIRGQAGGYVLERPADQINVREVMQTLGGRLFDQEFCQRHSHKYEDCRRVNDCTLRTLWNIVQEAVDKALADITLADLNDGEALERYQLLLEELPPPN